MVKVLRWQAYLEGGGVWRCPMIGPGHLLALSDRTQRHDHPHQVPLALPELGSALEGMAWKVGWGGSGENILIEGMIHSTPSSVYGH